MRWNAPFDDPDRNTHTTAISFLSKRFHFFDQELTPSKPKDADADEYRRFVESVRETGADESPEDAFERAFKRVVKPPAEPKRQK